MIIESVVIGAGVYWLYTDLPEAIRTKSSLPIWHVVVFLGLFFMHGGSAEGTVLAGIATVIFRWLTHRNWSKPKGSHPAIQEAPAKVYTMEDFERECAKEEAMEWTVIGVMLVIAAIMLLGAH
jgi:hypothetical protein